MVRLNIGQIRHLAPRSSKVLDIGSSENENPFPCLTFTGQMMHGAYGQALVVYYDGVVHLLVDLEVGTFFAAGILKEHFQLVEMLEGGTTHPLLIAFENVASLEIEAGDVYRQIKERLLIHV